MPRWTVTKKFKSPPKSQLVEDPEPEPKSSEYDRRFHARWIEQDPKRAVYRRPKPSPGEDEDTR